MEKRFMNVLRGNKGVTLIVLVVTIVVILILTAVVLNRAIGDQSIIGKSTEAKFKTDAIDIKDRLEKNMANVALQGGDTSDIELWEKVKEYFGNDVNQEILSKLVIVGGQLAYVPERCTEEEMKWFQDVGIPSALSIDVIVKEVINSEGIENIIQTTGGYDLIFVLDLSASMTSARIKTLVDCVNSTINSILENDLNRIGVVVFSTNAATQKILDLSSYKRTDKAFTASSSAITLNKSNLGLTGSNVNYSTGSGTYTQKGILLAYEELIGSRSALKAEDTEGGNNYKYRNNVPGIMIITDGAPNIHTANAVPGAGGSAGGADGTLDGGYWTIITASHYKSLLKEAYTAKGKPSPMIFTIGTDLDTKTDVGRFAALTLKPSTENMNTANQGSPCTSCVNGYQACTKCNVKGSNAVPGNGVCSNCKGVGTTGSGSSTAGCTNCNTKGSGTKNNNIKPGDGKCGTCKGNGYTTTKCTKCSGSGVTGSTLAKPLYDKLDKDKTTGWYDFADYSAVGLFDASQLQANINNAIDMIDAGKYSQEVKSTGSYKSSTTLINSEGNEIEFEIDKNKPISINYVEVGLVEYEVDQDGKQKKNTNGIPIYRKIDTIRTTEADSYSYRQILNGQANNLSISNGRLVWSLREDYQSSTGKISKLKQQILAKNSTTIQQLNRMKPPRGIEITEVEIEYWVVPK